MNCQNCKTKLSCGCKVRVASDKTSCCSTCLPSYEASLAQKRNAESPSSPKNIQVVYNGPGRQH